MYNNYLPKILVLGVDKPLRNQICNLLQRNNCDVVAIDNFGKELLELYDINSPSAIIIGATEGNKMQLQTIQQIKQIEELKQIPIVFLLEEGKTIKVDQLSRGSIIEALYYPFAVSELVLLVKSLLRRSKPTLQSKIIKYKDISLDLVVYRIFRNNKAIHVSPTGFKILQLLIHSPNSIYSRQQIIEYVWGSKRAIDYRTVDVHINRLRAALKITEEEIPIIHTVRAKGYYLGI